MLLKDVFISVEIVFRNLLNRFIIYSSMHMAKCYSQLKREVISHLHGILSAIPCSFVIEVKYRKKFFVYILLLA